MHEDRQRRAGASEDDDRDEVLNSPAFAEDGVQLQLPIVWGRGRSPMSCASGARLVGGVMVPNFIGVDRNGHLYHRDTLQPLD